MTKRFFQKIACYIFALIGAFPFSLSSNAVEKEPEEHCTILRAGIDFLGGVKIYISDRSLKVVALSNKTYMVANAPSWRVVLFNPRNNRGLSMTMKEWMVHRMQWIYLANPTEDQPFEWKGFQPHPTKYLGRSCMKTYVHREYKKGPNSTDHVYVYLPNTNASEKACNILQKLAIVPTVNGIPIAFSTLVNDRQKSEGTKLFGTVRIEESSVPEKFFAYPEKFETKKREADIVSDGTRNKLIEDTFGF